MGRLTLKPHITAPEYGYRRQGSTIYSGLLHDLLHNLLLDLLHRPDP
jgi:hypothetical protein